ncbi:MAG: biotin/lipoyl-binding protein, partial [Acidaminococcaceae bacterium]|nr:biotin/lipoyl-binding protein [Acidaminococcaceae bacterium]
MTKQGSLQSLLQYGKQNKKKVALAIVCLVLAGTIGHRYLGKRAVTAPPIAARVQVVKAGPADGVLQGLNTTTALRAIADVALRTKVEAPIQEIFVHKNQFITKGQPLLELEHNNQSAKLQSAAAQINMNEAAAVAAQAEFA